MTDQIDHFAPAGVYAADNRQQLVVMRSLLREGMRSCLTPRQRQMVELYYYDRLTMTEIAHRLALNPSTVSRHLKAARGRLLHFSRQMRQLEQIQRS